MIPDFHNTLGFVFSNQADVRSSRSASRGIPSHCFRPGRNLIPPPERGLQSAASAELKTRISPINTNFLQEETEGTETEKFGNRKTGNTDDRKFAQAAETFMDSGKDKHGFNRRKRRQRRRVETEKEFLLVVIAAALEILNCLLQLLSSLAQVK